MIKRAAGIAAAFAAVLFLGTLLLTAVYLLPTEGMKKHVGESLDNFMDEGDNPFLIPGYKGSSLDNSTDAIMLGNAVFDSERPFYQAAMLAERAKDESGDTMIGLQNYVREDDRHLVVEYSRYWHGYLVVLKPLLLLLNFDQIRLLNGIMFAVLLAAVSFGFLRLGMWRGWAAWLLAVAGLYPVVIPYSLQYSSVFYIGTIALALVLYQGEWLERKELWGCFFLITGMCTSYMDFLTYPLFTLGMPLIACVLLMKHEIREMLRDCLCWGIGYFGMWMGKWAVGSLLSGEKLWIKALEIADLRVSGTVNDYEISRVMAVLRNFYIYAGVLGVLLFVVIMVWTVAGVWRYRERLSIRAVLPLLLTACMPVAWYLLVANHSYIHYWYTFRILTVSIFAVAALPEYLYRRVRG